MPIFTHSLQERFCKPSMKENFESLPVYDSEWRTQLTYDNLLSVSLVIDTAQPHMNDVLYRCGMD
jgi:hypothetical protein